MRFGIVLALLLVAALSARVNWFKGQPKAQPKAQQYELSMFYCGFGGEFCGQSTEDDVHSLTTNVILAFVNTNPDGSVFIDEENYPQSHHNSWKASGKKVLISVGGQNGNWAYIFASSTSITNFVTSVAGILSKWSLDGVDIDIESYMVSPRTVANMIL